jgi:hypothetical protein
MSQHLYFGLWNPVPSHATGFFSFFSGGFSGARTMIGLFCSFLMFPPFPFSETEFQIAQKKTKNLKPNNKATVSSLKKAE